MDVLAIFGVVALSLSVAGAAASTAGLVVSIRSRKDTR